MQERGRERKKSREMGVGGYGKKEGILKRDGEGINAQGGRRKSKGIGSESVGE